MLRDKQLLLSDAQAVTRPRRIPPTSSTRGRLGMRTAGRN